MGADEEVPFYLMPVAAVFGIYTLLGFARACFLIYANVTYKEGGTAIPPATRLPSRAFAFLVASVVGAAFGYARVVASVENAMAESDHALFDPFEILSIPTTSNATIVTKKFRELAKLHHPDKGGNVIAFQKINLAYRALSDDESRANWENFGHPDGPVQTRALNFALPEWLLHPEGTTAVVLVLLYLGMFAGLIYVVITWASKSETARDKMALENSVAGADTMYLASNLSPESTHMDVLFLIATTPENIEKSQLAVERTEKLREEKLGKIIAEKGKKQSIDFDDLTGEGGWAEDGDEEDENAKAASLKAKLAEEELAKERAHRIAAATGSKEILLEGIDDGVLGQKWVEQTLKSKGQWPPDMGILEGKTFSDAKGNAVSALDHPAVRRNLCMTMGRLNANYLNTHTELLEAGSNRLIDETYFKSTMEFRQRCGLLLEAALRLAMTVRSYRLAKTIVETVSMFKVGANAYDDEQNVKSFREGMQRTYGKDGVPRLVVKDYTISTPGEDEMATGDISAVQLQMERSHAENFTKQKIDMCQKQGIPPQVALNAYREGWWILVRAKKIDSNGEDTTPIEEETNNPLAMTFDSGAKERFMNEVGENRLLTAWPLIVQNVAQKGGKVKIQFKAPPVPGRYRFYVAIKSQEFLGADQEFKVEKDVFDAADVTRVENEETEGGDDDKGEDAEPKKEK